ncbi:unnamed protein product [Rotaria magnacalcarata]|uniref:Uncharacterized protein n=1 Tax=Rotaria magnacalcarata TaxID=392030 RepID=A0A815MTE2_9BILA|nr:unnamed protein product [Rotaria magnacalcarata]CAF1615576.1 unnamed protein product [Rotaria magnacalcarata]CAF1995818.1 unnamed protein product [Rotaria magnacalcarata]CAF2036352.1 unnamed protein product [Rotaria magnacalcarata]CAF2152625.1 unnamed protein product [Rotaria magnacalcarata]
MNRWFILASILIGFAAGQVTLFGSFGQCSYTGDPHLIPFPTGVNQPVKMYYCNKNQWEVLLQNKWIMVIVKAGPSPFVILDHLVIFFDGSLGIKCILSGSLGLSTCPLNSSVISITNILGTAWSHWYPAASFLNIQITSYPWGLSKRYDITIRETFALIGQSAGLCVKNNCPLETVISVPPPVVVNVCEIYITAVPRQYAVRLAESFVGHVRLACHNDLSLTMDIRFARTALPLLVHSALDQLNSDNYKAGVVKAEADISAALVQADVAALAEARKNGTCWQQKLCLSKGDD